MAARKMELSARAHDRILKVSPTSAELEESAGISAKHLAEASLTGVRIGTIGRETEIRIDAHTLEPAEKHGVKIARAFLVIGS